MARNPAKPIRVLCFIALIPTALAQVENQASRGRSPSGRALELNVVVERILEVTDAAGQPATELVPVVRAASGDQVVYTVAFTNASAQMAEHVRITNPIPAETSYLADTAVGPGSDVLYSVDGGRTFGFPAELFLAADDGSRRAAETTDYTHIRWVFESPLDSGARGFVRFRAAVR